MANLESYITRKGKANKAPVYYSRQYAGPMDVSEVFDSISALEEYLAGGIAYAGQVVAVVAGTDVKFYGIKYDKTGASLVYEELGAGSGSLIIDDYGKAVASTDLVKGQVVYVNTVTYKVRTDDGFEYTIEKPSDESTILDTYKAGPYIVTSVGDGSTTFNTLESLSTSAPGGASDIDILKADVSKLKDSVSANKTSIDGLTADVAGKVDKVDGKSLIDDTLIAKLEGVEAGAQVNKIETIKVNGVAVDITDKAVDIKLPDVPSYKLVKVGNEYKLQADGVDVIGSEAISFADKFVQSGEIVTASAEHPIENPSVPGSNLPAGDYIKLTLSSGDVIYIATSSLFKAYTAAEGSGVTINDYKIGLNADVLKTNLGVNDLVAKVGDKAVKFTAEEIAGASEGDPAYGKTTDDIKTPSSGVYKYADDLVADLKVKMTITGSNAINVADNVVSLKVNNESGNIKFTQSEAGLSGEMMWNQYA